MTVKSDNLTKQSGQGKEDADVNAKTGAKAASVDEPLTTTVATAQSRSKSPQSKKKSTRKKAGVGSAKGTASSPGSKTNADSKTAVTKNAGTDARKQSAATGSPGSKTNAGSKTAVTKNAATDTQKPSAATGSRAVNRPENNRSGNGLAWVAILGSVLALGLSGYAAYQSTLSQALSSAKLSALDERLTFVSAEQKSLTSGVSALDQKSVSGDDAQVAMIRALEQVQNTLQSTIAGIELASKASTEDIKASLGKNVARWKLDEVHSLLSRVNQFYQLTGDKVRAEAGLMLANATLATIDNPHLGPVKAALAEDLLRIQSDVNVDTAAINSRLLALSALVPDMNLIGESIKVADSVESSPEPSDQAESSLIDAGKSLLGDLGSLVKYKNLDAPLRPSLDGGERFVLYELLQLKLQTAMVALIRHNNVVFQSQLKFAEDEINTYFDLEQAQTQTVLNELKSLSTQNVSLNIKPVSGALSSLSEVMILEN